MILRYKAQMARELEEDAPLEFENPAQYTIDIYPNQLGPSKLFLLTAGRRAKPHFAAYAESVLTFDWQDFYEKWDGEIYFEWLREQFKNIADVILIDSRTGVTEMGGVCTYQMADAIVMFCAPNQQNLEGTYEMATNFTSPQVQKLRVDRPLNLLIVPARIENAESDFLNEFQQDFLQKFANIAPKGFGVEVDQLWQLAIPYVPRYAYKEIIAVREKDKASAKEMVEAFVRLLGHLSLQAPENGRIRQVIKESTTSIEGSIVQGITIGGGVGQQVIITSSGSYIQEVSQAIEVSVDPQTLRTAYLNRLLERTSYLSLTGIDPKAASVQTDARLDLSVVYTALLTLSPKKSEKSDQIDRLDREVQRFSALAQLNQHSRLVLLGDPGSGKSTFVDFVTMCLAGELLDHPRANLTLLTAPLPDDEGREQAIRQPWGHGPLLPVQIILRDFAARGLPPAEQPATAEHMWRFIAAELKTAALDAYVRPLVEELHQQGGLLLLDGLDDVPEANQRRLQIKQAIMDFAVTFPKCRILVTCRTYAYQKQDWRLPGFAEAVLAPFSRGQMRRFVERWYRHLAKLRGPYSDDTQGQAAQLTQAIFGSERLAELAARPLLLTLMVSLHAWRSGTLPEKREELYADMVDLLLDWWESPKTVKNAQGQAVVLQPSLAEWLLVDRERVRALLNQLAFEAHRSQPDLVGTADVAEGALVGGLLHLSQNPDLKPARLVEYLSQRAGLLLPRGMGIYTFPQRTFQEYLAACHLTDHDYPDLVAELSRTEPNRWREVALLAGAKAARGSTLAMWALVEALCYREPETTSSNALADVWGAHLAGQILVEMVNLEKVSERYRPKVERVRHWLVNTLALGELLAVELITTGDILAHLGDPRRGMRLRFDSLPDIIWQEVPAGPFLMGSDTNKDPQAYDDEFPAFQIDLPTYKISRYAVTNAQYQAFVEDRGYTEKWRLCWTEAGWHWKEDKTGPNNSGAVFDLPNHPVVMINSHEATAFCRWLTTRLHQNGELGSNEAIMLPSEPQWEKAARGIDNRIYPWGNELDPNRANFDNTGIGITSAVGCLQKGVSPYGCEDMSGNIWEWTSSLYQKYPYKVDGREYLDGKGNRVIRGGSYKDSFDMIRCSSRRQCPPDYKSLDVGLRVVISPI
jgi:formylglycine-generating enzyme required for sulfatase activity